MEATHNQRRKAIQGVLDVLCKVVPYEWFAIFLHSISHNLQDWDVAIMTIILIDQEGCWSTSSYFKFSMF